MPVVIRLARTGSKHDPRYRITVADSRRYATKKSIEVIGHYNPVAKDPSQKVQIDLEKANQWIKNGAQPSDRVRHVLALAGQPMMRNEARRSKGNKPKPAAAAPAAE